MVAAARRAARLRRDRPGRPRRRGSSTPSSASSTDAGIRDRALRRGRAEPRRVRRRARRRGPARLRARGHGRRRGRRRVGDGHREGARRCARRTTSRSGSSATTTAALTPGRPDRGGRRRPPGPAPRPTASASSPTRPPAARAYVGHPSLLPVATILDPALTVGLPPAATAATGIDAMTHSLESLLSANPNPFAEAMALAVIRTVGAVAARPRWPTARDLEARSRLLMASHLAGVGQASGTGVGLVHALGHALGTRGRLPHGTALAVGAARGPGVLRGGARPARPGAGPRRGRPRRGVARRRRTRRPCPGDRGRPRALCRGRSAADAAGARLRRRDARPGRRGRHRRCRDPQLAAAASLDEARVILASVAG